MWNRSAESKGWARGCGVIYEAYDCNTGEVLAAFDAPSDQRAGFRLRYEIKDEGMAAGTDHIRLRRAQDLDPYKHITTAVFDWLPRRANG